jgi:cobalt-precorrin 5A hydrolase
VEIEDPSDTVHKFTGAYGVSEPAAKLYAGVDKLVLTKKKSGNATISVGLMPYKEEGRA